MPAPVMRAARGIERQARWQRARGRERVPASTADGLDAGRERCVEQGSGRSSPVVGGFLPSSACSSSGATTKIESCFVSLFGDAFACTVKLCSPLAVGVPEMTPFAPRVSPGGSVPPASVHELTVAFAMLSAGAV